jgi:hypothetical protein
MSFENRFHLRVHLEDIWNSNMRAHIAEIRESIPHERIQLQSFLEAVDSGLFVLISVI